MNPIDDLFAFTSADYGAPNEKKKKRKKRKLVTSKSEISVTNLNALSNTKSNDIKVKTSPTITATSLSEDKKKGILLNDDDDTNKEEDVLTNLLGLSETSAVSELEAPVIDSFINNTTNNQLEVEDAFLTSLNSYLNAVKQTESETKNLLRTQQQEQVKIHGKLVEVKSVKFEFHITIQAAGQVSGSYDLQVKGSTKISKLINTLLPLFNQDANPKFPEDQWPSLVLYIEDLNIILNPDLKCLSLLAYKNQMRTSNNVTGFEVSAMITLQDHAHMLHSTERERRKNIQQSLLNNQEADKDSTLLNIEVHDNQNQKNSDINIIEIDHENDLGLKITKMAIDKTMLISELINIYKYKVQLPMNLNISIFLNNDMVLDTSETLEKYNIKENDILKVKYSIEELNNLNLKGEVDVEDDLESDTDDIDIQQHGGKLIDDGEYKDGDSKEEYFPVIVVGKDKKRFKVDIKPSTKIMDIAKYYLQKTGLLESTKVKLLFDDEELDLNDIVRNTELEENFMIDVVIS